ncbi:MAG: hypothetical protein KDJ97_22625 [Anaerolineae bacterium]|nr:hypothetical protein [Anaerolineae bacterium]
MDTKFIANSTRMGSYTAIGGAVTMIVGAILWGTSGADLWVALDSGDVAGYLAAAGAVQAQLIANLTLWMVGVLILGMAGAALANLCVQRPLLAQMALVCIRTGVPLVLVAYIAMLALVVQIAPDTSATSVAIAQVVGWIGVRADDLATALMIGAAPLFFSLAGRDEWAPVWLVRWGYLAGVIGLLSLVVLYIPPLRGLGFIIIPVGVAWMIAAGIVLLRRSGAAQKDEGGVAIASASKEVIL